MALLSKLLIPVIAGLSLVTTTVSYAQQVGFKYKVGAVIDYNNHTLYEHRSVVVEVGSCNEKIRKADPDSDCHETHWYKVRLLHDHGANVFTLTNEYEYVNQKDIYNYIGMLQKIKKYE